MPPRNSRKNRALHQGDNSQHLPVAPPQGEGTSVRKLGESFGERIATIALAATTILTPIGAALGTLGAPRASNAAVSGITLSGVDCDNTSKTCTATQGDTDLRITTVTGFTNSAPKHKVIVSGLHDENGLPSSWVNTGVGSFNSSTGEWTSPIAAPGGSSMVVTAQLSLAASSSTRDRAIEICAQQLDASDNIINELCSNVTVVVGGPDPTISTFNDTGGNFPTKEDTAKTLGYNAVFSSGASRNVVSFENIAPGSEVTSVAGSYNPSTGIWQREASPGNNFASGGVTITPPADSDIDDSITVWVREYNRTTGALISEVPLHTKVIVDAVATNDAPVVDVVNASGVAGQDIPLSISSTQTDTDGSQQTTAYEIEGLSADATLSAGTNQGGGKWRVNAADIPTVSLNRASAGNLSLTVTAISEEVNIDDPSDDPSDNSVTASANMTVTIDPAPTPSAAPPPTPTVVVTPTPQPPPTPVVTPTSDPTPEPQLCFAIPLLDCIPAQSAAVTLKDASPDSKDKIVAQWKGETDIADFGDPLTNAAVGVCLYDKSGYLLAAAEAPAGGDCPAGRGFKPCWTAKAKQTGFVYRDTALTPEGVQGVTLTVSKPGKANGSLKLTAKGDPLVLPGAQAPSSYLAPGASPATLQIHRLGPLNERQCWTASLGDEKKNTATDYVAKCGANNRPACAP